MPYEFYKIIHFLGLFLLFSGLISLLVLRWSNHDLTKSKIKTFAFATHGTGLLFLLVSGFGLLARLQLMPMPHWAYGKLAFWGLFALAISLVKRKGNFGLQIYSLLFLMFFATALLAVYKPDF
jgi:hypothetical protein